jgi:hypothetical protein
MPKTTSHRLCRSIRTLLGLSFMPPEFGRITPVAGADAHEIEIRQPDGQRFLVRVSRHA